MNLKPTDVEQWVDENQKHFLPPVCNKLMHNGQLKVFFVGGPNVRKDYHLNEGEELFYMLRGNMCLKVMEKKKPKDIPIREGDIFLLPGKIPHSPQREANTVGLVIERERLPQETDALRYYVQGSSDVLFERWFRCEDLGTQLKPIIQEFFDSEECATQVPKIGSVNPDPPYCADKERVLMDPFPVSQWLRENKQAINKSGFRSLFGGDYESKIGFYGKGEHDIASSRETFLWQWEGSASVTFEAGEGRESRSTLLEANSSLLIPTNSQCVLLNHENGTTLSVTMSATADHR